MPPLNIKGFSQLNFSMWAKSNAKSYLQKISYLPFLVRNKPKCLYLFKSTCRTRSVSKVLPLAHWPWRWPDSILWVTIIVNIIWMNKWYKTISTLQLWKNFYNLPLLIIASLAYVCESLQKKLDHYGIRGPCKNLVGSFLSDRTQFLFSSGITFTNLPVAVG